MSLIARRYCTNVVALGLSLILAPAALGADVRNGDFSGGFRHWDTLNKEDFAGSVFASRAFFVEKSGPLPGVAVLEQQLGAERDAGDPPAFLDSSLILAQDVKRIPGATLSVEWGTSFAIELTTNGWASYSKKVVVENLSNGAIFEAVLVTSPRVQLPAMCPLTTYVDGFAQFEPACFDLSAAGFSKNDNVRVSFISQIRVQADEECDRAVFLSRMFVDNVTFSGCSPAPKMRTNPDGIPDGLDAESVRVLFDAAPVDATASDIAAPIVAE